MVHSMILSTAVFDKEHENKNRKCGCELLTLETSLTPLTQAVLDSVQINKLDGYDVIDSSAVILISIIMCMVLNLG